MIRAALIALVLLASCSSGREPQLGVFPQEPIAATALLPWGNRVSFGSSVDPARYGEVLARTDQVVSGRLPGVSFELYARPIVVGNGARVISFRAPTLNLIVLSHTSVSGVWTFGDLEWEVEHLVAGTDDNGRPWNGR